ncbi:hypothetical protein C0Q70_05653 [Pomacea canaliculata]|uniref:Platelet-derived growth factor (PDGF) family profile domain-containing protein n=1 Tax=Pomacea canaliculata TaxID=400727 RepID=A0A2T7PLS8_POMCA|nr:hypothetical protein C0Q70_05653 [Pomacea canaliculata]
MTSAVHGQQGYGTNGQGPQSAEELMASVHSVDDFIGLLVKRDGRPVAESEIFSPYTTPDGKRVISGGGVMATPDDCSPRNMTVRLPLNYTDTQVVYYPECTMVQRCGGCCPVQFLTCEPLYKEQMVYNVLKARYLFPGSINLRWEGMESVTVERHLSCRAVCSLRETDCNAKQRYIPQQCKCQCRSIQQCYHNQRWDSNSCACVCLEVQQCCPNEDDRSCRLIFDNESCSCTLKSSIEGAANFSREELRQWELERFSSTIADNSVVPDSSTTTTTTTTTQATTTTSAASNDPCLHITCPRNFSKRLNSSGRCVCQLNPNRIPRRRRDIRRK